MSTTTSTFANYYFPDGIPNSSFIVLQDSYETNSEIALINLLALTSQKKEKESKILFITLKNNQLHYYYILKKMNVNLVELEESNRLLFIDVSVNTFDNLKDLIYEKMSIDTYNYIFIDGLSELYWKIKDEKLSESFNICINFCHYIRSYLLSHNGSFITTLHYDLIDSPELLYLSYESNFNFVLSPLETGRSATISGQCTLSNRNIEGHCNSTVFYKCSDLGMEIKASV